MIEALLVLLLAVALGWPLGRYLARVMRGDASRLDVLFAPVERAIYALLGIDAARGMNAARYVTAFLASNFVLGGLVWLQFMLQGWLPLNPDAIANLRWDTALHTAISFLTNTDQQHYAGQAQLSYLSQIVGVVGLQMITPMMGLALVTATLRAMFGGRGDGEAAPRPNGATVDVGNYWVDVTRASVRFMLPLCLALTVLLVSQGVPATLQAAATAAPIDAAATTAPQVIPRGPVAPLVAVKQLGTNGGGWYGPNGAMPLENPTPLSNLLQMVAIVLIPVALTFMAGAFTRRRSLTGLIFGSMLLMSLVSLALGIAAETQTATGALPMLMEGKEVRFGADSSALWAMLTTQTSNGSVNAMHDSLAPLTGGVALVDMLINAIWGGIGCGLQQFLVYLFLTVFLAGLMTGRTPELFGRKIEAPEVRLLALLILLQPVVVLGFTAAALTVPGVAGTSNPGFHGFSQVFYEYVSAFANNGSGFEGLADASYWWNLSCAAVLALGRYPALIVPLIVAQRLARKRPAPVGSGTLPVESTTFALTLIAVVGVLTVLQFLPALVLGPIADHLTVLSP